MKKGTYFIVFFVFCASFSFAQEQLLTVGFQYKPIFSSKFFGAGEIENSDGPFKVNFRPKWGHSYGMVIRRGFNKTLSYEVGINYVKRNYSMTASDLDSGFSDVSDFGIVSYEIPNQALVYIRLGERFYMNNAMGFSVTAFASDVESKGQNNRFYQISRMTTTFFSGALIANVGFEYRSEKSGFFYLGASFHKPIKNITNTFAYYDKDNFNSYSTNLQLTGTYLTLDFRYFFHEAPIRKPKNSSKPK